MIALAQNTKIFIVTGATDMRKAIDGLAHVVADHLEADAFSGHLFVFCNRTKNIIKILYWDRNGFCLWQKRLEKHRFHWPETAAGALALDPRQLTWLLDGLDPQSLRAHPKLTYKNLF